MTNRSAEWPLFGVILITLMLTTVSIFASSVLAVKKSSSNSSSVTTIHKAPSKTTTAHHVHTVPSKVAVGNATVGAPIATSGNNIYIAWPNNDTGHWGVFLAKSTDGGKTLGKTTMLSAPNNGNTVDQNTQISASGSNVYVTWWTNKTGTLMPVLRASNDGGNTFGKTIMLNSTSIP